MALAPRQTGSSIKMFVLAAAIQAGAQPDDIIDGQNNCVFDVPGRRRAVRRLRSRRIERPTRSLG